MRDERERFCEDAYPDLVAALELHCGDLHLAEELAQEALIRACQRWDLIGQFESPAGWCYRVGVNLANSHFRRLRMSWRVRRRATVDDLTHHDPDSAERITLRAALEELSDKERQAVLLRYFLGMSSTEAAEVLGSTAGAVRVATHRAVKRLRAVLGVDVAVQREEATDGS